VRLTDAPKSPSLGAEQEEIMLTKPDNGFTRTVGEGRHATNIIGGKASAARSSFPSSRWAEPRYSHAGPFVGSRSVTAAREAAAAS